MDLQVEIKEEPVWSEGKTDIPVEDVELASDMKPLKQQSRSELTELAPIQENAFEPSADIKGEISIEQDVVRELVPHIKEEDNVGTTGEGVHRCTMCSEMFPIKINLIEQWLTHSQGKPQNSTGVHSTSSRTSFIKSHSPEGGFHCPECNAAFKQKGGLLRHMVTHSGERPPTCKKCQRYFTSRGHLSRHMMVHSQECSYCCQGCNKTFKRWQGLRRHMVNRVGCRLLYHTLLQSGERSCQEFNSTVNQRQGIRSQEVNRVGERLYSCQECECAFTRQCQLRNHMLLHSRERSCQEYNITCNRRQDVRKHKVNRVRERTYACKECKTAFPQQDQLRNHMLDHCGVRNCEEYNSMFNQIQVVLRQTVNRVPESSYAVKECTSVVTQQDQVRNPMLVHCSVGSSQRYNQDQDIRKQTVNRVPEGSYACTERESVFTQEDELQNHMLVLPRESSQVFTNMLNQAEVLQSSVVVHSGEIPFRCSVCYSTFTQRSMLGVHMQNHFGVKP